VSKTVLIDEIHLAIRVPADLPGPEADAASRTLNSDAFLARLRRAVAATLRAFPELAKARARISR
jgi:hypothetical protein